VQQVGSPQTFVCNDEQGNEQEKSKQGKNLVLAVNRVECFWSEFVSGVCTSIQ